MSHKPEHQVFYAKRFALWLGIASMVMMFAGLTSAYIVNGYGQLDQLHDPVHLLCKYRIDCAEQHYDAHGPAVV